MKFRFPRRNEHRKGQSLLEALVSLSVLTVGLLGILSLLAQSFLLSHTIADQLTATYLAGEGVEIARDIIYHEVFSQDAWGTCLTAGYYDLDFQTMVTPPANCPNSTNPANIKPLYFDPVTGLYGDKGSFPAQDKAIATKFTRVVQISYPSAANGQEAVVTAKVAWGNNSYTAEDHFYNWYP